jgi:hypothetical protein
LTLFIHAEHDGPLGRVEIEPHDIGELLHKTGITRHLEGLHPVRGQTVGIPNPVYRGSAHPDGSGQSAAAPVRLARRLLLLSRADNRLHLGGAVTGLAPSSRRDLGQALQASLGKAPLPLADGGLADPKLAPDLLGSNPGQRRQHDAGSPHDSLGSSLSADPAFQFVLLFDGGGHSNGNGAHRLSYPPSRLNETYL